jgi:trk system potassium uptake protein TrkH
MGPQVPQGKTPVSQGRQGQTWLHPTRLIVIIYVVLIAIGAGLLLLPVSTPSGMPTASLDTAVFTATSALTVTGLVVVDTATEWSRFGQVVVLALIQLGGFGITTFASVFAVLVFRRLGLRARLAAQLEQNQPALGGLRALVGRVAVFYVVAQILGVALISLALWRDGGRSLGEALWQGTFHTVSAFNNAGFTTFEDGMAGFAGNPWVLVPVMVLVVAGGIGFPVVLELWRTRLRRVNRWSIHTRLTLVVTLVLLVVGVVGYAAMEWNNPASLGALGGGAERMLNAAFASVTARTAGFNTIDYAQVGSAGQVLTMALMFIGGGSASAAGGIKVTTLAVLGYVVLAELRSDREVNAFGRRLSEATQRQALTVALLGMAVVVAGAVGVAATSPALGMGDVLFETVSAVATTGLSTGVTPELESPSRFLLAGLMLLGRLGPVTFGTALVLRRRQFQLRYPEGRPLIG